MASKDLPEFNEATGPHSARYFKACALSKRMQAERKRLFEEGVEIRKTNPSVRDAFNYQHAIPGKRQPNPAEAAIAEFVEDGNAVQPGTINHEALARAREIGASTQELDDALKMLGEKTLELHVRACREFTTLPAVQDAYRPIGARIANAILELAAACAEHDQFIEQLRQRNVNHHSWLGHVEKPSWDRLQRMLRSAFEAGHIAKSELDQWRDKE